ncbi:MAG: cation diffusion facilitator family transporter, partial [Solirubrobacteraceae bacterium]
RRAARRFESAALRSNAFHFGADMAGSLAVLAGLLAADAGLHQGDSVAALLVAAIIFATSLRLIGENANVLMDRAPSAARAAAERSIARLGADIELRRLRLRESGGRYFADVVVSVPPGQAVVEGHQTADRIEQAVEHALPGTDVVVHVEPRLRGIDLRDRVLAIALSEPLVKEAHDIVVFHHGDSASVSLHLKFPDELSLSEAHAIAERVERAIAERPGVSDVQTHLEPLERPLRASGGEAPEQGRQTEQIEAVVRELSGSAPRELRLLATDAGSVVFLTLAATPGQSLVQAHRLAGELEDGLRGRVAGIIDVVVHTEP